MKAIEHQLVVQDIAHYFDMKTGVRQARVELRTVKELPVFGSPQPVSSMVLLTTHADALELQRLGGVVLTLTPLDPGQPVPELPRTDGSGVIDPLLGVR